MPVGSSEWSVEPGAPRPASRSRSGSRRRARRSRSGRRGPRRCGARPRGRGRCRGCRQPARRRGRTARRSGRGAPDRSRCPRRRPRPGPSHSAGRRADRDRPAGGRELDGVREHVPDHLSEPGPVGIDEQRCVAQLRARDDASSSCPSASSACSSTSARMSNSSRRSANWPSSIRRASRKSLTSAGETGCFGIDDLQVARPVGVADVALEQQSREAEDACERCPDLVRDHADQLRLVTLGLLEALGALDELLAAGCQRLGHRVERAAELAELVVTVLVEPHARSRRPRPRWPRRRSVAAVVRPTVRARGQSRSGGSV